MAAIRRGSRAYLAVFAVTIFCVVSNGKASLLEEELLNESENLTPWLIEIRRSDAVLLNFMLRGIH
jgi:hypothetical protein